MKAALLLAAFALLSAVQTHGSSVLSSSDHEHSAEISDLFVWLRQNGAKVRCKGLTFIQNELLFIASSRLKARISIMTHQCWVRCA